MATRITLAQLRDRKAGFEPTTLTLAIRSSKPPELEHYESVQVGRSTQSIAVYTMRPNPAR